MSFDWILALIIVAGLGVGVVVAFGLCLCIAANWAEGESYLCQLRERDSSGGEAAADAMPEEHDPGTLRGVASPESLPIDPLHVVTWHPPGTLSSGNSKQRRISRRCEKRKKNVQRIGAA
jgi:hypothetical protein